MPSTNSSLVTPETASKQTILMPSYSVHILGNIFVTNLNILEHITLFTVRVHTFSGASIGLFSLLRA
jgi:hypothetical protein